MAATVFLTGTIAKEENTYELRLSTFQCESRKKIARVTSEARGKAAWLPTVRAQASLVNQKPAQALELLESVKPYEPGQLIGNLSYSCMIPVYLRGEAYLATKLGAQALGEFQKLSESRGVVGNCWSGALAILGQARARAVAGSTSAARNSYQRLFDLWKTADADIPILQSARREFARLK